MSDVSPTVFIIILNWNGLDDTLKCLASVEKLDYQPRQVVIVDNGSSDGSPARLKASFPHIPLIEHSVNQGYTGGNNAGMRFAIAHGADYLWLLNNDTIPEPDCLTRLITRANADHDIGLLCPLTYHYGESGRLQFGGTIADMARETFFPAHDPRTGDPDPGALPSLLWGTALLVKSSVVQRIGYLDDRYFAYHEDVDYSLRAIKAGFHTAVEPTAVLYHKWATSSGADSPFRVFLLTRNWYLFWSSHLTGSSKWTYPSRYVAWAIRQAVSYRDSGNPTAADACLDGAWSALRGSFGPPENRVTMPAPLKHLLLAHPYFWNHLLAGKLLTILGAAASRLHRRP